MSRPTCNCHGLPMGRAGQRNGQRWRCAIKLQAARERGKANRQTPGYRARKRVWAKTSREKHRDAILAAKRRYRDRTSEQRSEYNRRWLAARLEWDPDYLRRRNAAYREANKDARAAAQKRREARKRGAGMFEHFTREQVFERDEGRCYLCGVETRPGLASRSRSSALQGRSAHIRERACILPAV